jgi:hypothetical protein
MHNKCYILFWLSAIIIIAGFQTLYSIDFQVKLTSHYDIKVCSDDRDKDIVVTVGMGNVVFADSLYAFDILIEFDPTMVKFEGPIYQNTLAEYIPKYRDVSIGHESKYIRAIGYTDNPLSGNREIVGFYAKLLTDCDEPITLKIIDFDLTDDFNRTLFIDSVLNIVPFKVVDENKKVEINFNSDSLVFDNYDIANTDVTININPYTERDEMFFDIQFNDDMPFEILNVVSSNPLITIDDFSKVSDNHYEVKINIFGNTNTENALTFVVKETQKSESDVYGKFSITPRVFEECNCYAGFYGSEITLLSKGKKQDTTVSVRNQIDKAFAVYCNNNNIEVANEGKVYINKVEIYDLLGNMIDTYNINGDANVYNFNSTYYKSGYYFMRIVTLNYIVNKSIILYN